MSDSTLSSSDSTASTAFFRRIAYGFVFCAAAGLGLAAILNVEPLLSANDRSRWATVRSLVELGSYRIDEVIRHDGWDTIDKVRHEGHFYSSKPPLLSTLVAGVTEVVEAVTGWTLAENTAAVTRIVLVLVNLVPMLVVLIVWARFAERYAQTDTARLLLFLTAAFGTYLSTYIVTLNNHTPAAVGVVFAIYAATRVIVDGSRSPGHFAAAGFFAAFACTNELPAAVFGVAVFLLLLRADVRRTLMVFVPAAVVPLAGFFVTNYLVTGGIKPFYAAYGTETYEYVHEGVPSYWMFPKGIDANDEPPAVYLLHCTFGHHGIFSLMPVFLLTLAGWCSPWAWRSRLRIVHLFALLLTGIVLIFYLSRPENYNYGGNTAGLRWTFWLIPFWLVGLLPLIDAYGQRSWFRGLAGVLLAVSVFSAASAVGNPWQPSWLYGLMKDWKWIDYSTPAPAFERPLCTWFSSLPPNPAEDNWIEFVSADADGTLTRLRLEDGGRITFGDYVTRKLVATWNPHTSAARSTSYHILEDRFQAGLPPEKFILWPTGLPDRATRDAAYAFLRNLPRTRPYNADHIRYLKTPLRNDAIRTQKAASRVPFQPPGSERTFWYRSETWITNQVPFGVVRFESVLRDEKTDEPVGYRRYDAVAASWVAADPPPSEGTVRKAE